MIWVITGGREKSLSSIDKLYLTKMVKRGTVTEVVCGMCRGIDLEVYHLLKGLVPIKEMPAEWDNLKAIPCKVRFRDGIPYNSLAGFNRNLAMLKYATATPEETVLLAFPGGPGTAQMKSLAKKQGITTYSR